MACREPEVVSAFRRPRRPCGERPKLRERVASRLAAQRDLVREEREVQGGFVACDVMLRKTEADGL